MGVTGGGAAAPLESDLPLMPLEEWRILHERHPNVLIQGSASDVQATIVALMPSLPPTVRSWYPGTPLALPEPGDGSLVLHDIVDLTDDDQHRLQQWLSRTDRDPVQILSTATTALFPLVQQGRFLAGLY